MASVSRVATALQDVFITTATHAAAATGCVQRRRKFTGASLCQALVFGWLAQPEATLVELCQSAAACGVQIAPQSLNERFTEQLSTTLERVLGAAIEQVLHADPVAIPLLTRFGSVCVQDTTVVTLPASLAAVWPGCGDATEAGHAATIKLGVRLTLTDGTLAGPVLVAGRVHDRRALAQLPSLPKDALRLQDLGFFSLGELADAAVDGIRWVTRVQAGTALFDLAGQRWTLPSFLAAQHTERVDATVELGVGQRLPCRILAVKVPDQVAGIRIARLKKEAHRRQQRLTDERIELAHWTVLITNLPPDQLTLEEALILARARWQIELLFKLWKQHGQIDVWRSANPWRILCELYAKLLAMVVQHWLLVTSCWPHADHSLPKAAAAVRADARRLAADLGSRTRLLRTLRCMVLCLGHASRQNHRKAKPATFQLLLDPRLLS
jgi:Transposase DDE domain